MCMTADSQCSLAVLISSHCSLFGQRLSKFVEMMATPLDSHHLQISPCNELLANECPQLQLKKSVISDQ